MRRLLHSSFPAGRAESRCRCGSGGTSAGAVVAGDSQTQSKLSHAKGRGPECEVMNRRARPQGQTRLPRLRRGCSQDLELVDGGHARLLGAARATAAHQQRTGCELRAADRAAGVGCPYAQRDCFSNQTPLLRRVRITERLPNPRPRFSCDADSFNTPRTRRLLPSWWKTTRRSLFSRLRSSSASRGARMAGTALLSLSHCPRLLRHLLLGHGLGWSERGTGGSTVCVSLFSSLPLLSRQNIYVLQRRKRKRFKFICIVCTALFGRQYSASEGWAVLAPNCLTAARARVLPRQRAASKCGLRTAIVWLSGPVDEPAFYPLPTFFLSDS